MGTPKKPPSWRVKRLSLRLGRSRTLRLSLRRFRTPEHRRSKKYKQVVYQPRLPRIREIALAWEVKKAVVRPASARLQKPLFVPALMVTLGISGILSFAPNLTEPAKLNLIGPQKAAALAAETTQQESPKPSALAKSVPTNLQIPKIAVSTALVPVGLAANGSLALPNGFDIAGWYDQGPTPGELGPSIIVGHVDRIGGIAVFWRLRELVPGDTFIVQRADGSAANFVVTEVEQFSQDNFPTDAVYGPIDYAGIRLITCGGVFSAATQHYSHNTVIYGRLSL